jgi:hypothetical protein
MELCEVAPNKLFYFCPSSLQRVSRGRSIVPYCTERDVYRGVALPYDTLFLDGEKSGMKSTPLVHRNKYQNGFYCDAI